MASPARITDVLPETLPGDFVEWDEASRSAQPFQSGSGEPGPGVGVVSNPATQAAEAQCTGTPSRNLPRGVLPVSARGSTSGAAALDPAKSLSPASLSSHNIVGQRQAAVPAIDELRPSAPRPNADPAPATMSALDNIHLHSFRTDAGELTRAARKKWPIIAGASAALVVILAAAMTPMLGRGRVPSVKPAAALPPAMTPIQQPEHAAPTRDDSTPTLPKSTAATTTAGEARISSEATPGPVQKNAELSRHPAPIMVDQLHAPTRLNMKVTHAEEASLPPGGFAAADIHGLDNSNAIGAVFDGQKQPKVQIASQQTTSQKQPGEQIASKQAISVPSGVALALLIQKTDPVYPWIAKQAQVSGTIVLAATISKTGKVESLHVVSGPAIFHNSAVEAVRTWRFKPYVLNNQPRAIETMINLHFSVH